MKRVVPVEQIKQVDQVMKHNILFRKLNNENGFSLTETLSTMIIMSFVGIMVTTGIISASRAYKQITEHTNAQLMLSNTITALHDELIYALPDSLSGGTDDKSGEITFEHIKNGEETIKFQTTEGNKGIYINYGGGSSTFYPLVSYQSSTSLYNKWSVKNEGNGVISIDVSVCKDDGTTNGKTLITVTNYEIKLLNG